MKRLSLLLTASAVTAGCADPCHDDGFGQSDCSAVSASASTAASNSGPDSSASTSDGTGAASQIPLPLTESGPETDESSGSEAGTTSSDSTTNPITLTGSGSGSTEATTLESTSTVTSSSAGPTTDETSGSSSTGDPPTETYCTDADVDGFGDPSDCTDVPADETPPAGTVANGDDCHDGDADAYPGAAQNEPALCARDLDDDGYGDDAPPVGVDAGTDCIDDNPDAYPGAAPLDDTVACMEDADTDGYGDSMPPAGAMAGGDCDDGNEDVPSIDACLVWCLDADIDQYGDPSDCVFTTAPPMGYVGNDADCDDGNPNAFPGSAPNDDENACMLDVDDDQYGDASPGGAIDPGTDCDDLDINVQLGCFDCPAGTLACNSNDDLTQCNPTGTFAFVIEDCGFGCDETGLACWPELTVEAQANSASCAEFTAGETVDLFADVAGGDGNYSYSWAPAASLDDASSSSPIASPTATGIYTVGVDDTEGNTVSDDVMLHLAGVDWNLEGPGCQLYTFPDPLGNPSPPNPNIQFFSNSTVYCSFAPNGTRAWVCPQPYVDARITFEMQVLNPADDDVMGMVWGWQDAANFYVMSWKQNTEFTTWGLWQEGITIKRISAASPDDVTEQDLFRPSNTPNATLLASPALFFDQGWDDSTEYRVQLDTASPTHTLEIRRVDNGTLVMSGSVSDGTYPSGAAGSFESSQTSVCNGFWESSCIP